MEFCSDRELQNQTGHPTYEWPLVIVKELIDNALDACEEAEVAPEIAITVEKDSIVFKDKRGGIGAETIESSSTTQSGCPAARRMSRRQRRAGERAKDHPRHGLRARPRERRRAAAA